MSDETPWTTAVSVSESRRLARKPWPLWWAYPGVAMLALVGVILVMRLWQADLRTPLTYHAEAFFNAVLVKGVLQYGWHLSNFALSAPTGLDMRDVPMSDNNLHFVVLKLLGLLTPSYALVMNLFFLLTFPLTAMTALFAFRQFRLAMAPSVCGSLLYSLLHFHFSRGQHHLFLAAYYLVPLLVMVALWIMAGAVSVVGEGGRGWDWSRHRPRLIVSVIVCALVGSAGIYYAYFSCFFLLVAGMVAAIRQRRLRALVLPIALVGLTSAILVANVAPSLLHLYRQGGTPTLQRSPIDAETLGLRISQLLMPISGHRFTWVARLKDAYNARHRFNESADASLGLVGSLGFLALLGWPLSKLCRRPPPEDGVTLLVDDLSILNLSAVLLGTIGGFGSLVALTVSSKIRAYNRISIFIAFFSLIAVVVGLDYLQRRYGQRGTKRVVFVAGLTVLLTLGLLDQTSKRDMPKYGEIEAEYRSDAAFIDRIASRLPAGTMVFQLPEIPFPEHPPVHGMHDYDHARGFLHADQLRWSYGAMKGRATDAWQKWVAAKPLPQLLETLVAAGFRGLYVNREGYRDRATALSGGIERELEQPPLRSDNGRLLFFDLTTYQMRLRDLVTSEAWEAKQEAALHPLLVVWQDGCSDLEGTATQNFRWCSAAGIWRFVNGASRPRRLRLEGGFWANRDARLSISGPLLSDQVPIGPVMIAFSATISIPPGQHALTFSCDGLPALPAGDPRKLVFRVVNFRAIPLDP